MNHEVTLPGGKKVRYRKLHKDWYQVCMPGSTPNRIITKGQAHAEMREYEKRGYTVTAYVGERS